MRAGLLPVQPTALHRRPLSGGAPRGACPTVAGTWHTRCAHSRPGGGIGSHSGSQRTAQLAAWVFAHIAKCARPCTEGWPCAGAAATGAMRAARTSAARTSWNMRSTSTSLPCARAARGALGALAAASAAWKRSTSGRCCPRTLLGCARRARARAQAHGRRARVRAWSARTQLTRQMRTLFSRVPWSHPHQGAPDWPAWCRREQEECGRPPLGEGGECSKRRPWAGSAAHFRQPSGSCRMSRRRL